MEKILFIGGDQRSLFAISELKKRGFPVSSFGLTENDFESIGDFDVLVLPVPTTRDKTNVFCPLSKRKIPLSEIAEKAESRPIISCGYKFENKNSIDVLSLDSYAYLNAVPTTEGAISFAIQNTDFTLWKAKILVIGNGRVSKVLVSRLKGFCPDITVSARKPVDFSLIDTQNIRFIKTSSVKRAAKDFDIIFNTVDAEIFDDLSVLKDTVLIDLSTKGCLDFDDAERQNLSAFKLPGLPGKVAPKTAGIILADTVFEAINSFKCNN